MCDEKFSPSFLHKVSACCLEFGNRASEQLGRTRTPGNEMKAG